MFTRTEDWKESVFQRFGYKICRLNKVTFWSNLFYPTFRNYRKLLWKRLSKFYSLEVITNQYIRALLHCLWVLYSKLLKQLLESSLFFLTESRRSNTNFEWWCPCFRICFPSLRILLLWSWRFPDNLYWLWFWSLRRLLYNFSFAEWETPKVQIFIHVLTGHSNN